MSLPAFLSDPLWQRLTSVLLQTLWQGPVIAVCLYVLLRLVPARHARLRYALASAGLLAVVMAGLVTWSVLDFRAARAIGPAVDRSVASAGQGQGAPKTTALFSVTKFEHSAIAPMRPSHETFNWTAALCLAWLTGVGIMLVRLVLQVGGAYRLRRTGRLIETGELPRVLEDLRRRMSIGRSIRLRAVDALHCPAVVGLVWPTLLIPVLRTADMPIEAWVPILAHELAHIRRYDALVNLAQMLIEAVLFFNPAVWWISRQMQIEREACCDALAVSFTSEPSHYARSLVAWAERSRNAWEPGMVAIAFAEGGRRTLLDRARRLLVPRYRPELRVSWLVLVGAMIVGAGMLAGLFRGTHEAVALAARILAPAERMQRLVEAQATYAPLATQPAGHRAEPAVIEGVIRTEDGESLAEPIEFLSRSEAPKVCTQEGHRSRNQRFSISVAPGAVWIQAASPGYAPANLGPFTLRPGEMIDSVDILLKRGFEARIQLVGESGAPVSGASLEGDMQMPTGGGWGRRREADESGIVVFAHTGDGIYKLKAEADGFEPDERELKFAPNQTVRWVLRRAKPTTGTVLDLDGTPIADAALRMFAKLVNERVERMPAWHGEVLALTDDKGRFTLDRLSHGAVYTLLVETPDARKQLVHSVRAGQENLQIRLEPEIIVRGRVTGDLNKLKRSKGSPCIDCQTRVRIKHHSHGNIGTSVPVDIQNGTGKFEIRGILPGTLSLTAGGRTIETEIERSRNDLVIELDGPGKRLVLLRLKMPQGAPSPTGTMMVQSILSDSPPAVDHVEIVDGQAEFDAHVGGRLFYQPEQMVGAWFKEGRLDTVPAGEEPLVIEIPGHPAGAIVGHVQAPRQTAVGPSINVNVHAAEGSKPAAGEWSPLLNVDVEPVTGKYMAGPLPLGGTYVVKAGRNKNVVFSEPVVVDQIHPLAEVDLMLADGRDAQVVVLGPDGRPVSGIPVSFSYDSPGGGTTYSPDPRADEQGRVTFEDLNPDDRIEYSIRLPIRKDYQAVGRTPLKVNGTPTVVHLEPGLTLHGKVIERLTGRPIPGAEVYATRQATDNPPRWFRFEAEENSDRQGRFHFSNLAPGRYTLSATVRTRGLVRYRHPQATALAGQTEPVEVFLEIPDWKTQPAGE